MFQTRSLLLSFAVAVALVVPARGDVKTELPKEVVDALKSAEQFELYTLNPDDSTNATDQSKDYLHGWRIVDHKAIADAKVRAKLVDAFVQGTQDAKGAMRCFRPRHAIRVTHSGKRYDLVMSFECLQSLVYEGDAAEGFTIRHRSTTGSAFDIAVGKLDLKVAERK